jgi:SAM-dependent methyltransferase
MFTPWANVLLEVARPQPGERVLDVACGTGIVARTVAPMVGPNGRVAGLDVNAAMLAVARSLPPVQGAPIEWREESALAMTLPDASFDLVLCQQGLQFFPDKTAGVREMRRVLKSSGRAVVACWQSLEHNPAFDAMIRAEARRLNEPVKTLSVPFSLGDADELRALFTEGGFRRVEVMAHRMVTRFPQPDRFVQLSIQSGAAVIPALRDMDPSARAHLANAIGRELRDELAHYIEGDFLASPLAAHIVVAS